MNDTKIPGCQNVDCYYRLGWTGGCDYFVMTGTTRTGLHKDENVDINNPCREYLPTGKHPRYQPRVKRQRR
jgi:hypothetical protein